MKYDSQKTFRKLAAPAVPISLGLCALGKRSVNKGRFLFGSTHNFRLTGIKNDSLLLFSLALFLHICFLHMPHVIFIIAWWDFLGRRSFLPPKHFICLRFFPLWFCRFFIRFKIIFLTRRNLVRMWTYRKQTADHSKQMYAKGSTGNRLSNNLVHLTEIAWLTSTIAQKKNNNNNNNLFECLRFLTYNMWSGLSFLLISPLIDIIFCIFLTGRTRAASFYFLLLRLGFVWNRSTIR